MCIICTVEYVRCSNGTMNNTSTPILWYRLLTDLRALMKLELVLGTTTTAIFRSNDRSLYAPFTSDGHEFLTLYFVAFHALLAGQLSPYKWNQAWHSSEVIDIQMYRVVKAILRLFIYKALYDQSYLGSKTTMTTGERSCLISFAWDPLTCSERRGGSEKFKMKIYVSIGIRTHASPRHD